MSTADQNKRALLELLAASDAGDVDKALSFYAPDYEDHDASEARAGRCPRSALREAFQLFRSSFTQTRHVVDILLAQDDLVAALIRVNAHSYLIDLQRARHRASTGIGMGRPFSRAKKIL